MTEILAEFTQKECELALLEYISEPHEFPPNPGQLREIALSARRNRAIEIRNNPMLSTDENGVYKCKICQNTGNVFVWRNGYEYYYRCKCGRGNDLNKWSREQITRGATAKNDRTKKMEVIYVACITDIFSEMEIAEKYGA